MKKGLVHTFLSYVFIAAICASSLPLALLHHHEHQNICEANSNIPVELKKDKDESPVHLHKYEAKCFLCFQNHSSTGKTELFSYELIKQFFAVKYSIPTKELHSVASVYIQGRAPPAV